MDNKDCCPPCTSPPWWTKILNGITDIATAIRELIAAQPKVIATGVIHYTVSGYGSLTNNVPVSVQLFKNALNFKIIGFGVSYLGSFPTFGSNPSDDKLKIQLWDFGTNDQIGNTLELNVNQSSDKHTNEGNTIGHNLALGEIGGVKITFQDTESQTFTGKAFDVFIYVVPVELQPVVP